MEQVDIIPGPLAPIGTIAVDFTKPVRTKGGKNVQIIAIVHAFKRPILGRCDSEFLRDSVMEWNLDGRFGSSEGGDRLDLGNY